MPARFEISGSACHARDVCRLCFSHFDAILYSFVYAIPANRELRLSGLNRWPRCHTGCCSSVLQEQCQCPAAMLVPSRSSTAIAWTQDKQPRGHRTIACIGRASPSRARPALQYRLSIFTARRPSCHIVARIWLLLPPPAQSHPEPWLRARLHPPFYQSCWPGCRRVIRLVFPSHCATTAQPFGSHHSL